MVTEGGLDVRSSSDSVTIEGYASTFNQPYDMGWYTETVASGAFSRPLGRNPDVRFLINHDGLPLARTTSRTLDLAQDTNGLHFRATCDASDPDVQRVAPKMIRGDLNEMSFAFGVVEDEWSEDYSQRTLRALNLDNGDVSLVTYPANPNATASMRSRVLATAGPEQLRTIYRSLVEGGDRMGALTPQMRSMLEDLTIEDAAADVMFNALAELVTAPAADEPEVEDNTDDTDEAAEQERQIVIENELRRARVRLELLK
jgi:HK97 family phage prohead protease